MSAPNLPRFVVASATGFSFGGSPKRATTAYSVLDTWYAHREVLTFAPIPGDYHSNDAKREAQATARCAELEAWHEQAMGEGT